MHKTDVTIKQTNAYTEAVRSTTADRISALVHKTYRETPFVYSVFDNKQELYIVEIDDGHITEVFQHFVRNETLIGHMSVDCMTIAAFFERAIMRSMG